jgi:phosphotriesterase-related protein
MKKLLTTLGPIDEGQAGIVLPHEHVFVDLRTPETPGHGVAPAEQVVRVMRPSLEEARAAGIGCIVEASCVGVGRRADILRAVSEATRLPLLAPTGVYREPWVPRWVHDATEAALTDWMIAELTEGIEKTGVRAGWIKLSAGDNGLTACEEKILRAALRAARETGSVIGSHSIRGAVVKDQLRIIGQAGLAPGRFIWIHTQAEPDFSLHLEAARQGVWLEYDDIGGADVDEPRAQGVLRILDAGLAGQLLLSQDRGWFNPALPEGGEQKSYAHLVSGFLPRLERAGVDQPTLRTLTRVNPFSAFSREER